jgi:DNA-binding response OmpR family regulator
MSEAPEIGAPVVLLLGKEALALATRLQASGYRPLLETGATEQTDPQIDPQIEPQIEPQLEPLPAPQAVLLSACAQSRIAELRQRYASIPLLLDVGADSVEGRVLCLSCGADDFWLSQQGPSDLLMRLRLHLEISQRAQIPIQLMQVADLVVNPMGRQVKRGSRSVALTAREYQLLLLLLERKGTVVSRDQILRNVWKDQQATASNVIEVYVRYLRQKLEQGGERRLLHTVRGQGYCLAERLPHSQPEITP